MSVKTDLPKALSATEAKHKLEAAPGWHLADNNKALAQDFLMDDFLAARDFINQIAAVAEAEDHHPDLHLTQYRKLRIVLSTHDAGGLTQKDFTLAAKINALPKSLKN